VWNIEIIIDAAQIDVEGVGIGGGIHEHVLDPRIGEEVLDDPEAGRVTTQCGCQLVNHFSLGRPVRPQVHSLLLCGLGDELATPAFHPDPHLGRRVHLHVLGCLLQEGQTCRLDQGHLATGVLVFRGLEKVETLGLVGEVADTDGGGPDVVAGHLIGALGGVGCYKGL